MRYLLPIGILSATLAAQTIVAPYNSSYSVWPLGSPQGVLPNFGGVAFRVGEPNVLYLCGAANTATGVVYKVPVSRDANLHLTGFSGPAVQVATAPNNDGGLEFGPGGVLFFTRYNIHHLGQLKPGSTAMDKSVSLALNGFPGSVGALSFVPAGYPQAGKLKLASYNANRFATATLTADTSGTYDVTSLVLGTTISGGVEGFFYAPPDSPLLTNFTTMLVCEYGSGQVTLYTIDANGDPVAASRQLFMTGLSGAEGAAIDPLSGDFVFSTFGGSNRVIAVRGFGLPCGATNLYGQGLAGTGNKIPQIGHEGCFARRQNVALTTANGLANAPGVLIAGLAQQSFPIFGGTILVAPSFTVGHGLNGSGVYALGIPIPDDTYLLNTDFFFQSVYLDAGALQGISFTQGLKLRVR